MPSGNTQNPRSYDSSDNRMAGYYIVYFSLANILIEACDDKTESPSVINSVASTPPTNTSKPTPIKHIHLHRRGYWETHSRSNIRRFFDKFARDRYLDPLKASTWYNVDLSDIAAAGVQFLFFFFDTSLSKFS
jgi:hypothetical protein